MPRPTALDAARTFRSALANDEAQAASRMATIYNRIYTGLQGDLAKLSVDIAAMDSPSRGAIMKLARMQAIQQQVKEQVTKFGGTVQNEVTIVQSQAVQAGIDNALKLIETSLPPLPDDVRKQLVASFVRLPADAVEAAGGLTGTDSPLNERLSDLYGEYVAEQVGNQITAGIAKGDNPRTIARQLEKNVLSGLGSGLTSALKTVRTAQIKSYQLANHATYLANDNIVKGWVWHAELGSACFPAGTLITTKRGNLPIETVVIGDSVLTHTGKWQKVSEVMSRSYSGEMVTVKASGVELTATKDHPLLVERQGQLNWVEISKVRIDDRLICNVEYFSEIANHFGGGVSVKRSIGNPKDHVTSGLKPECFYGVPVLDKFLTMPIDAIYLDNGIKVRQEKVNRVFPARESMLLKIFNAHIFKTNPDILFRLGLSCKSSVASWGAKLLMAHCRNNPKIFTASQTGVNDRRSPALFGTVFPGRFRSRLYKNLSASGTRNIFDIYPFASHRAKDIIALIARKSSKFLSASWAYLFRAVGDLSAFQRAIGRIPSRVCLKLLVAVWANFLCFWGKACSVFPVGVFGLMSRVTFAGTEFPTTFFYPGGRNIELGRTSKASFNHSDIILRNAHHTNLVYNMEVEEDHSYFANGIAVHNCLACTSLHGSIHPLDETLDGHHNCRCAPIPQTITYADLGLDIPETAEPVETGEDWFNQQPAATQRELMGGPMFDAWKAGKVEFGQLSKPYDDAVYGTLLREASLKDILGDDAKEFYK